MVLILMKFYMGRTIYSRRLVLLACRNRRCVHTSCSIMERQILDSVLWCRHVNKKKRNTREDQQQRVNLNVLEPFAPRILVLHELVSFVHDHVNVPNLSQLVGSTSANDSAVTMKGQHDQSAGTNLSVLEGSDPRNRGPQQ
ncbi:hypothetical protein MANES_01G203900v8 [Manihot esculenta]|uniref:Uncharacterized protein n=2 Tax=Manihot esculenta TaxID=3983 RepID=A0ACB7IG32_MANES|nr:hypothetical protein MANES_01G203900v8 [Manihot esculenta]KAG8663376.1 hypothetical protein MANES_01G203900v8 [Manihot esculenta]